MIEAYQRAWAALQTGRADRSPCANPLLSHEKPTQRRSNSAADFRDIELSVCPDTLPRFDRILRPKHLWRSRSSSASRASCRSCRGAEGVCMRAILARRTELAAHLACRQAGLACAEG